MPTVLDGLSKKVFDDRYALRDAEGRPIEQSPDDMWARVAKAIASVEATPQKREQWSGEFERLLRGFQFVPGGRILSGAGSGVPVTFYNCFVIPSPDDSRGGIFDNVKLMVEIMSRSGGVGVNLSSLRPRGSYVRGVNGSASGSVSFGGLYSHATGLIIQGGSRRGALMLMLNDDHPDIEEFITVKRTMGLITNANLSVCISDRFMEAVQADADWDLKWGGKIYKTIKAQYLWNLICESAWASGEPGTFFIERANKRSNTWYFEPLISTNPCGEQPLGPWSVCNLGSLNVDAFAIDTGIDHPAEFDWDRFRWAARVAIRFLDDVIDATYYPYEENRTAQMGIRRTGLGFMGLGDLLIKMHLRYGSPEGVEMTQRLYRTLRDEAYRASVEIAREKGAFPKFDREKYLQGWFIQRLPQDIQDGIRECGIRNAVLLTQAPTGTTSLLAGVSSGIEPIYDFVFIRKDRIGEHEVYHPRYKQWVDAHPNETVPAHFVNAKQLTPEEHVRTQAAAQEYIDSSISKTVNAPEAHTVEEVKKLYMLGYELGCKGMTYFRENSRSESVLSSKKEDRKPAAAAASAPEAPKPMSVLEPRPRPEALAGKTYKVATAYGTLYITINSDEQGQPFEVFATIGKSGGFFAEESEGICRLLSLALRSGIPAPTIIGQIKGIRGPMPSFGKRGMILSIPDAIAQVLEEHIQQPQEKLALKFDGTEGAAAPQPSSPAKLVLEAMTSTVTVKAPEIAPQVPKRSLANVGWAPECPTCGTLLQFQEGCMSCRGCGYSKCA
ncbi:adenosylcobalamin-dependent ribonucleoside-diphosphate reductase [Candidatus Uhrbacteria bacterium]|nr:adenosylcobalamin-dependent ribonucleoside-diphosphate reductase [Candidatus Uhrbacteria bacterium]